MDSSNSQREAMDKIANAIIYCFSSPNIYDSNLEAANPVDVLSGAGRRISESLNNVAKAMDNIADAIRQRDAGE